MGGRRSMWMGRRYQADNEGWANKIRMQGWMDG